MDNLPPNRQQAPDRLRASDNRKTVAISGWTGNRAIALGDKTMQEWLTFEGALVELSEQR